LLIFSKLRKIDIVFDWRKLKQSNCDGIFDLRRLRAFTQPPIAVESQFLRRFNEILLQIALPYLRFVGMDSQFLVAHTNGKTAGFEVSFVVETDKS
jgi:hypothetical protein